MTLNKAQQQEWIILESVLKAVSRVCPDISAVREEMKLWIADFERFVNHDYKVKIISSPELSLKLVDCSRDSMKVSVDAVPSVTLRARNESIQVTVKAAYRDNYAFTNSEIAESLRTLAEKIERLGKEVSDISEDTDLSENMDKTVSVVDQPAEAVSANEAEESVAETQERADQAASDGSDLLEEEYGEVLLQLEPAPEEDE